MGYQELWPSDLFGFAPEADAHWADTHNPYMNTVGAAVHTKEMGPMDVVPDAPNHAKAAEHGHGTGQVPVGGFAGGRRLRNFLQADETRVLVPAAVRWPSMFEPDFVACAPSAIGGQVFAFTATGNGAMIPGEAATGSIPGAAVPVSLHGLPTADFARGVTWSDAGLTVVTGRGNLHHCTHVDAANQFKCQALPGAALPVPQEHGPEGPLPAIALQIGSREPAFAAVATDRGEVQLLEREIGWQPVGKVQLPYNEDKDDSQQASVISLSASQDHLIVSASDGATYRWELRAGRIASAAHRDSPAATGAYAAAGNPRTWRGACVHPSGRIVRLAARWQKAGGIGSLAWHPELLL
jgi:hypothetical protein